MQNFEKQYLDSEKSFFDKLSKEEKQKKISETGNEEGAIQQHGYELAARSMDKKEKELSLEEKEQLEKMKVGAKNVISSFSLKRSPDNKKGENLLIIADSGADTLMIKALMDAGQEIAGDDCRVVVAPKTEYAAQEFGEMIGEKMKTSDAVLLVTSLSRTHSKETVELAHPSHSSEIISSLLESSALKNSFPELRKKYSAETLAKMLSERKNDEASMFPSKSRIISITNTERKILTEGGALENPIEMKARIDKFAEAMNGVEKVKITSKIGSNLELDIKVRSLAKETGIIDKPGTGSNFPFGEYGGAVDLAETNGVYVIDGAVGMIGRPDRPIKLFIEKGKVVEIEGGESANKLRNILEKINSEYQEKNPDDKITNAFKLAEFSFGMNSKAFRYAEDGERISPPTSLEAEKGLGTIHIALGKNTIFNIERSDPDYNDIPIHIDCVAMFSTIKGIKEDGKEVEIIKDGEIICL